MTKHGSNKIENIVIVGGGTAGWLSAAYLSKALSCNQNSNFKITLIESSNVPTIGVGEATLPLLAKSLKYLGISERDWMQKCNATYKLAIKFVNWSGLPEKKEFWHPFGQTSYHEGLPISSYWLEAKLNKLSTSFAESCFEHVHLCKAKKSPKPKLNSQVYSNEAIKNISYGYHLDAGLFADYLKKYSKKRGVKQILDKVVHVCLNEQGFIDCLTTENHKKIKGDLFIDCSGFKGLLINQSLNEPFISYSDSLLCDRAIAISSPYEDRDIYNKKHGGIEPYTTATALSSGWSWKTPLVGRNGNGYVYASDFISQEEAEAELRQHLGAGVKNSEAKHIKMRVGRTRNSWSKNCVSIGLSSGFIEPLESTGIYLIEVALYNLLRHFPNARIEQAKISNYNRIMNGYYDEIRDFIVMHYCLTNREDSSFWKTNKYSATVSKKVQDKLEFWKSMLPLKDDEFLGQLFPEYSYICLLDGMGHLPVESPSLLSYQKENILLDKKSKIDNLTKKYFDHDESLEAQILNSSLLAVG